MRAALTLASQPCPLFAPFSGDKWSETGLVFWQGLAQASTRYAPAVARCRPPEGPTCFPPSIILQCLLLNFRTELIVVVQ